VTARGPAPKALLVKADVFGYILPMTHSTAATRRSGAMTVPAFEAGGNLLALVPKSALKAQHTDIDIVVVGKSRGSTALVAELKSASSQVGSAATKGRHVFVSFSLHDDDAVSAGNLNRLIHGGSAAPAMAALLSRFARALTRAAGIAGDELIHRALERPSDMGAVIDLLRSALPLLSAERELDPALDTQIAALEAEEDLIRRAGGLKDTKWVADYLGISPKSVAAKARRNELLAITRGDRNLYPAFQFGDGQVVGSIRDILQVLPLTNGWSRLSFLLSPDPGLDDRTPLEAFTANRDVVLALAVGADTHGAA